MLHRIIQKRFGRKEIVDVSQCMYLSNLSTAKSLLLEYVN